MTNKEAILVLKSTSVNLGRRNGKTVYAEALKMAITALNQLDNNSTKPDNSTATQSNGIESKVKGLTACRVPEDDCISRRAAIDAILAVTGNSSVRELYEHVQQHGLSNMWSGGVNAAIDIIIAVPPAHPETCDTCKHGYFGDEQCSSCRVRFTSHYERRNDGSD